MKDLKNYMLSDGKSDSVVSETREKRKSRSSGKKITKKTKKETVEVKSNSSDTDSDFFEQLPTTRKDKKENPPTNEGLMRYFNTIDKSSKCSPVCNVEKLKVEVVIHSPPKVRRSSRVERRIPTDRRRAKLVHPKYDDIQVIEEDFVEESWMRIKLKSVPQKSSVVDVGSCDIDDVESTALKTDDETTALKTAIIEDSNDKTVEPVATDCKLAPVFLKRSVVDSRTNQVVDEKKQKFLRSGIPKIIKRKMDSQKSCKEEYRGEYSFPRCTHVRQLVDDTNAISTLNVKWKSLSNNIPSGLKNSFSFVKKTEDDDVTVLWSMRNFDLKRELTLLKTAEPSVNVSEIYSIVRKSHNVNALNNHTTCWTDKYRPMNSQEVLGNTSSVGKLREWIESHKSMKIRSYDNECSSDEFVSSEDSNSSVSGSKNNVAILFGPPGCGKTCTVYALANELNFKVIEINAGSNRTGKRIIEELLEATQSHRVKRTLETNRGMKKIKKKKINESYSADKKSMSLILIEDVDILFKNHDEGFLSSLNSLANLSKRPLIFTANSIHHPHLSKFNKVPNLVLKFAYPSTSLIGVWLQLIAMTEGVKLSSEVLVSLMNLAGSDLRKNLLQLQLQILSKNLNHNSYSRNWQTFVSISSSQNESEEKIEKSKKENIKKLGKFCHYYDQIVCIDILRNTEEIQKEKYDDYNSHALTADICGFLNNELHSNLENNMASFSFSSCCDKIRREKNLQRISESVISSLPKCSYTEAVYCDVMPAVRDIARTERSKYAGSSRRTTRYFNYLKSVNIHVTDTEMTMLCESLVS